jgi:hypothetical protein
MTWANTPGCSHQQGRPCWQTHAAIPTVWSQLIVTEWIGEMKTSINDAYVTDNFSRNLSRKNATLLLHDSEVLRRHA